MHFSIFNHTNNIFLVACLPADASSDSDSNSDLCFMVNNTNWVLTLHFTHSSRILFKFNSLRIKEKNYKNFMLCAKKQTNVKMCRPTNVNSTYAFNQKQNFTNVTLKS